MNDYYSRMVKISSSISNLFVYGNGDGDHNLHNDDESIAKRKRIIEKGIIIQNLLASIGDPFKFPTIVVVGSQSSGKSSLLDSLIGFTILPKGPTKMVTKRPIEISLINSSASLRLFLDDAEMHSISALRSGIMLCNVEDKKEAIRVKIESPNVPTLSFIDLPGLIELNSSEESPDLPDEIKKIHHHYLKDNDNIMLSLTPAPIDIATFASLRLSREMDPTGLRTIGILTKADLLTKEEQQKIEMETKKYPLALGYCLVSSKKDWNITLLKKVLQKSLAKAISRSRLFSEYELEHEEEREKGNARCKTPKRMEHSLKDFLFKKYNEMSIKVDLSKFENHLRKRQKEGEIVASKEIPFFIENTLTFDGMDEKIYSNAIKKIKAMVDDSLMAWIVDLEKMLQLWRCPTDLIYRTEEYKEKKKELLERKQEKIERIRKGINRMLQVSHKKFAFKQFRKEIELKKDLLNCFKDCKEEVLEELRRDMIIKSCLQYGNLIIHHIEQHCKAEGASLLLNDNGGNASIAEWLKGLEGGDDIYEKIVEMDRKAILGEIRDVLRELKE